MFPATAPENTGVSTGEKNGKGGDVEFCQALV